MITLLLIIGYILMGVIIGRCVRNEIVTEHYVKHIEDVRRARKIRPELYTDTAEEHTLKMALEDMHDNSTNTFLIVILGWFWPVTAIFYILGMCATVIMKIPLFRSAAEKEVSRAVADNQRRLALDAQEKANEEQRLKLLAIAKEMHINTSGLEELL
jgi:hypothetical protein